MSTLILAQRAIHDRMSLAIEAASPRFPADVFDAWEDDDCLAIRTTVLALAFLNTLTVPADVTETALDTALDDARWQETRPKVVFAAEPGKETVATLAARGYALASPRPLAIRNLVDRPVSESQATPAGLTAGEMQPDELDVALAVLIGGYETGGDVGRFIEAEPRDPRVRRFAVHDREQVIAVAAMSIHGEVAVLGGASTLPLARGRGAQSLLLAIRLAEAAEAGCRLAAATAAPGSPSARNLVRAGFTVHDRPTFERFLTWIDMSA